MTNNDGTYDYLKAERELIAKAAWQERINPEDITVVKIYGYDSYGILKGTVNIDGDIIYIQ